MIEKAFIHGAWHYNMETIGDIICKEAGPCQMRLLLPQVDIKHVDGWMTQKNAVKFLDWYAESTRDMNMLSIIFRKLSEQIRKKAGPLQESTGGTLHTDKSTNVCTVNYFCTLMHLTLTTLKNCGVVELTNFRICALYVQIVMQKKLDHIIVRESAKVDLAGNLQQPC